MKRNQLRIRGKLPIIVLSIILLTSAYLLIRFALLSFSDDVGQAKGNIKSAILSNLSIQVMEYGSSLLSFSAEEEEDESFPISLMAEGFALSSYTKGNSPQTVMAQESSVTDTLAQDNPFRIGKNDTTEVAGQEDKSGTGGIDQSKNGDSLNGQEETTEENKLSTMSYNKVENEFLTKEYIMTNGTLLGNSREKEYLLENFSEEGESPDAALARIIVGIIAGGVSLSNGGDDQATNTEAASKETMTANNGTKFTLKQLNDVNFLVRNFYIVDPSTKITDEIFDAEKLLGMDCTIKKDMEGPQILIYHTHSQEAYIDSRANVEEDTIVGVGNKLTKILEDQYGYQVIHDTTHYDIINGVVDRNKAYNMAEAGIKKILEDNPSIDIIIDLHRDGSAKRATTVNGEETAQIMLFNGLSRDLNGPITYLDNPNLQGNLSFALQLQLKSLSRYPGLFYKNYLKCYRYNQHFRPKSILIELGTNENTLQSAKNAMGPFAEILDAVLQGK